MNVKIRTLYWESRKAIQLQPPKTPTCKNANLSFEIEKLDEDRIQGILVE